ncbi:hypothetical protein HDU89_001572 [Geranomyces variabilis]|nr:hypothetical protein HDU89_001572 [Geranomyces variabilis]
MLLRTARLSSVSIAQTAAVQARQSAFLQARAGAALLNAARNCSAMPKPSTITVEALLKNSSGKVNVEKLLNNNKKWAEEVTSSDPNFFKNLSDQQSPELLWIGCSDSRVPANQLLNLPPGEVFVHRNIANIVYGTDLNAQSVLQFSVDVLKVKHIIVCGHYNCGGVAAALTTKQFGLVDLWIRSLKDLYVQNEDKLSALDEAEKLKKMVELNIARSVDSVVHSTTVQNAWARGQTLAVHGWVYNLSDGRLHDLKLTMSGLKDLEDGVHVVG